MKNQKLNLADFQVNQLSKEASRNISGGKRIVIIYLDLDGNWCNADGEPIQNTGNGSGAGEDIEYVFVSL
jgi:hypothetical protein